MEQKSHETPSPSASSGFLPLGRRGSRGSLATTRTERENINATLDHIHSTAYQSDSLTLFNEFTNPPAPVSASEEKRLSEELQGGLSGLYSRFRTSVGGMRDIVSGAKSADKSALDTPAVRSPTSERSMTKSISDLATTTTDYAPSHPSSSQGSRLHSPVVPIFQQHSQDAAQLSNQGKSSKISSKTASVSSKTSISPSPGTKPHITPLTKSTGGSIAADSTIAQVHVNAVGAVRPSRSSSLNTPSHGLKQAESSSIGSRDGPVDMSMSQTSSVFSQNVSHSPVLSTKTHDSLQEEHTPLDVSGSQTSAGHASDALPRKSSNADQSRPPDNSSQSTGLRSSKHSELTQGSKTQSYETRSNSRMSFNGNDESTVPTSASNSLSKINPPEDRSYRADSASGGATPAPRDSTNVGELPNNVPQSLAGDKPGLPTTRNRLPGYVMSRASTAETMTTVSSLPPLNTAVSRVPTQAPAAVQQQSDGVLSQLRSRLLSRDFWMRDENAKDCFHCGEPFTTFRRKHHCRTCGQIFDSKCTLLISGSRFGQPGSIRVCKPCEAMINAHDDDSSEFSDSEQSPIVMNPRISELSWGGSGAVHPQMTMIPLQSSLNPLTM
ncbi:Zinc finger FYVE/PHD-type [Penicillium macrosclerotiorum]|uniref:Zinc finger FYVE/PHD-type n=1 Tax=Penicillium macrosclerotiorum TaxID=303699 RepID=UPI002546B3FF|nr:Zinc finger FYVE/PHD-type [Penicillium macrosclerotiorum]KAJ5669091.1 Zinc finger FYVE/PHD-type [Penicillium macrosclerotiorum]